MSVTVGRLKGNVKFIKLIAGFIKLIVRKFLLVCFEAILGDAEQRPIEYQRLVTLKDRVVTVRITLPFSYNFTAP